MRRLMPSTAVVPLVIALDDAGQFDRAGDCEAGGGHACGVVHGSGGTFKVWPSTRRFWINAMEPSEMTMTTKDTPL